MDSLLATEDRTLKLRPPPPPPPPQPLPQIKLNSKSNNNNNNYDNNAKCAHTIAQIPSSLIRPTTAGLLRQQQPILNETILIETNNEKNLSFIQKPNQPGSTSSCIITNRSLSSPEFKEELIRKQSNFINSSVPVEERIIKQQQKQTDGNKMLSNNSTKINNIQHLPEKLFSTAQREKKPFAYSPDVNDPNNRGKLDLSQIKSPIMRRRLLANMESGDSVENKEDEDQENKGEEEIDENENSHNCNNVQQSLPHQNLQVNSRLYSQQNGEIKSRFSEQANQLKQQPTVEIIRHYQAPEFENFINTNLNQSIKLNEKMANQSYYPSIQYYEKPVFYNTRYNDYVGSSPSPFNNQYPATTNTNSYGHSFASSSSLSPQSTSLSSSTSSNNRKRLEELSNEVDKSLNSLSELVSNLELKNKSYFEHQDQNNINNHQRMSSFLPHYLNKDRNFKQQQSSPGSPTFNHAHMVNGVNNKSIGDFLLSPDSSYFSSINSNTNQYPIAPYNGSLLNFCTYNNQNRFD